MKTLLYTAGSLLSLASSALALQLTFAEETYAATPGDSLILEVRFDAPVPGGLDAYALRFSFPEGVLHLEAEDIEIVPELDHDLFAEGPAERRVRSTGATVRGFSDFAAGPWSGTAMVTFRVEVPINAPGGSHTLSLAPADPDGNNFIDGQMSSIDSAILFREAQLVVTVPPPVSLGSPEIDPVTRDVTLRFAGLAGRDHQVESSEDLVWWTRLGTVAASLADGSFSWTDNAGAVHERRFYRARSD
jgi:hypothetical protein